MVELELDDYNEIFKWFNASYDEVEEKNLGEQGRKTFWKLHFLLEDKTRKLKIDMDDNDKNTKV